MTNLSNSHVADLRDHVDSLHRGTLPNGLTDEAVAAHAAAYPIDTHLDSMAAARQFGVDLVKPDWTTQQNRFEDMVSRWYLAKGENAPLYGHGAYGDLKAGGYGGGCISAHAIKQNLAPGWSGNGAWQEVLLSHAFIGDQAAVAPLDMVLARSPAEALEARKGGKFATIFSVEGAHCLGPTTAKSRDLRLGRLAYLKQGLGAAYLTLNHFCSTDISHSSLNFFGHKGKDGGLTSFGKEFVSAALEAGLLLDMSHTNEGGILGACDIASKAGKPIFASHASPRDVERDPPGKKPARRTHRGLTWEAIEAIADTGGCISLIMCPYYFHDKKVDGREVIDGPLSLIVEKYCEIAERLTARGLNGWKHLSYGTDFDGGIACLPQEMRNAGDLPLLTQAFLDAGVSATQISDLYSGNFLRVWGQA